MMTAIAHIKHDGFGDYKDLFLFFIEFLNISDILCSEKIKFD